MEFAARQVWTEAMKVPAIVQKFDWERWWVSACVGLSAIIQLSFMAKSSIWHDEGYTMMLAPQSMGQIIARTMRDVHPPLYYLLLHGWLKLFGSSETAARSLSMLAILLTIIIMFGLVKHLFGAKPARLAALFVAVGPFLIRYGQEARMYALAACFVSLATYLLVTALDSNNQRRLYLYGVVMALALFTHYYTVFMIPVHWLYVLLRSHWRNRRKGTLDIKSLHWWGANVVLALLFAPWLPAAFRQFSRVQGGFWIPPVTLTTLPSTMAQFLHFTSWGNLLLGVQLLIPTVFGALVVSALVYNRMQRRSIGLLTTWLLAAPVLVFILSAVARPIYVDRYFVYAAVAFYALLAVLLYLKPLNYLRYSRPLLIAVLLLVFAFGVRNVYSQANHQMRPVGNYVNSHFQPGDGLIAGELYVYFDFSYYNHTGTALSLYAPGGVSGYGETSLLYDRPQLIIKDYGQLNPSTGIVWLVAKPGAKDYLVNVPKSWQLINQYQSTTSAVYEYRIGSAQPPKLSLAD